MCLPNHVSEGARLGDSEGDRVDDFEREITSISEGGISSSSTRRDSIPISRYRGSPEFPIS